MRCFTSTSRWLLGAALAMAALLAGCSRGHYRRQADADAYQLIGEKTCDSRWELNDYRVTPTVESRMYDPTSPDCPPMPPDDPTSHRLMHRVDGKRGYKHWHRNGDVPFVENPAWRRYLPCDEKGALVLDRQLAMRVALVNSREYQNEVEDLYLSALDVSFQRFRFDAQFFLTNETYYENIGPLGAGGPSRELVSNTNSRMERLGTAGGQLAVEIANSLVWQFAGPDDRQARTVLDFSLIQPLLRGAGRAVVLEGLTDAERALLANVRQMEQFRHAFYTTIIAGRTTGPGPIRGGLLVEALGPTAPGATGGIYTLLSDQVRIRNQRTNVSGLRDSLDQLEAHYDAGRIDRLQVDIARQALFNAQSTLLSLETAYDDRLDAYKMLLGLPPDLDVKIQDDMLKRFDLVDPTVVAMSDQVATMLDQLRTGDATSVADITAKLPELAKKVAGVQDLLVQDQKALEKAVPQRRKELGQLASRGEADSGDVDPRAYSVTLFNRRVTELNKDFATLATVIGQTAADLEAAASAPADQNAALLPLLIRVSNVLLGTTLVESAARLETVTLVHVDLDPAEALEVACRSRLDWMNARAALVDSWRQIEVRANALKANFDVILNGDVSTTDNNPLRFRGSTGRLRVGFQFEAPLTRLIERNAYREALIDYQRSRRLFYLFEDRINQNLRANLRSLRQAQLDFELRRAGVLVAISQVDITRERLTQPPKPAAAGQTAQTTTFGATTARDLVQAYQGLLTAQNSFLSAWVEYEADRLNLDFELGTMQLDRCGMWVDPGPIEKGYGTSGDARTAPEPTQPTDLPPVPLSQLLQLPAEDQEQSVIE